MKAFALAAAAAVGLAGAAEAAVFEYTITSRVVNSSDTVPEAVGWPAEFNFLNTFIVDTKLLHMTVPGSESWTVEFDSSLLYVSSDDAGLYYATDDPEFSSFYWNLWHYETPQYAAITLDSSNMVTDFRTYGEWPWMAFTPEGGWVVDFWYAINNDIPESQFWHQTDYQITRRFLSVSPSPIPLPAAAPMLLTGAAALFAIRRKAKKSQRSALE